MSDFLSRGVIRPDETLGQQVRAVFAHLRTVAAGRAEDPTLVEQRTRLARARAQREELRLQLEVKELGRIADFSALLFAVARAMRDGALAWPDRCAPLARNAASDADARTVLAREVRTTLADIDARIAAATERAA